MRHKGLLLVAALALVGVLMLAVFPARAYFDQKHQRRVLASQVAEAEKENRVLADRAAQLQTDDEIERLARQQYNMIRPGEEVYAILPGLTPPPAASPAPAKRAQDPGLLSRAWSRITSVL